MGIRPVCGTGILPVARVPASVGRKADIMTRDSIHRVLRSGIEANALRVF